MKIVLNMNTEYGSVGDTVSVSQDRAERMIRSGTATAAIDHPRPTEHIEAKAILRSPNNRAARKVTA